jgi:restriction system protein
MAKRRKKEDNTLLLVVLGVIILLGILSQPKLFLSLLLITIGITVFLFYKKVKKFNTIKRSNIKEIDSMNGVQFENYLDVLFKSMGYKTKATPTSHDYGADLIIIKDNKKLLYKLRDIATK